MTDKNKDDPIAELLDGTPRVINLGLASFAQELEAQGVIVVQVDWSPPASGDSAP